VLKRIRQIAVMMNDLEDGLALYRRVLEMEPCHREDLAAYGLRSAVLPAGQGTFVELLQPAGATSVGARFLERRGEGPYLLIFETDRYDALIAHLNAEGARITREVEHPGHRSAFVHPGDASGAFIELVETCPGDNPWPFAGQDWHRRTWTPLTKRIRQVAVLVRDLDTAVARWQRLFGLRESNRFPITFAGMEAAILPLPGGETCIELAQPTGPGSAARYLERHGEGLYLLIFEVDDLDRVTAHLTERQVEIAERSKLAPGLRADFSSVWIHPRAMKGVFTQLSEVTVADHPWPPAGEVWRTTR
jgi:catechol 2,3-dioxygenase-like lactoylglutathione lyase family enzyme